MTSFWKRNFSQKRCVREIGQRVLKSILQPLVVIDSFALAAAYPSGTFHSENVTTNHYEDINIHAITCRICKDTTSQVLRSVLRLANQLEWNAALR